MSLLWDGCSDDIHELDAAPDRLTLRELLAWIVLILTALVAVAFVIPWLWGLGL